MPDEQMVDVETVERATCTLPSGAVQEFPAGWVGPVPLSVAQAWVDSGIARAALPVPGDFDAAQTLMLQHAANQLLAQAEAEAATHGPDFASMALVDLRKYAADIGIENASRMSKKQLLEMFIDPADEPLSGEMAAAAAGAAAAGLA